VRAGEEPQRVPAPERFSGYRHNKVFVAMRGWLIARAAAIEPLTGSRVTLLPGPARVRPYGRFGRSSVGLGSCQLGASVPNYAFKPTLRTWR
jgi:hypothetical protein